VRVAFACVSAFHEKALGTACAVGATFVSTAADIYWAHY